MGPCEQAPYDPRLHRLLSSTKPLFPPAQCSASGSQSGQVAIRVASSVLVPLLLVRRNAQNKRYLRDGHGLSLAVCKHVARGRLRRMDAVPALSAPAFHRCRLQRMDPTIQACLFNNCNCCHMQFFFRILPTSHCDWMRRRTPQPRHRYAYSRRERVARWHAYACHSVVTAARSRVCDELSSTG